MPAQNIKTLFLDIGGVLLTNAWGRASRKLAAEKFSLDNLEMDERHHLCFDTYEMGKLSMDDYLHQIVFYEHRNFSVEDFKKFIFAQSTSLGQHIDYFKQLKKEHHLKVFAINNEAKEMNEHRIQKFGLSQLFDAFISSCYVGLRKPDKDIFRLACDIAQTKPSEGLFIDDRHMFVEVAQSTGLTAIQFDNLEQVKEKIGKLKFKADN